MKPMEPKMMTALMPICRKKVTLRATGRVVHFTEMELSSSMDGSVLGTDVGV